MRTENRRKKGNECAGKENKKGFKVVGVYAFLDFYGRYIDGVLYAERLSQMSEVTGQLFTSLDEIIENQWKIAETQKNYFMEEQPGTAEELVDMMKRQARLNAFIESRSPGRR